MTCEKIENASILDLKKHLDKLAKCEETLFQQELEAVLENHVSELKNILSNVVGVMDQASKLEIIGKYLNPEIFMHLLKNKMNIENETMRKIPPLIVGMNYPCFFNLLETIDTNTLSLLQKESSGEPLNHKLTLFSHDLMKRLERLTERLKEVEYEIENIVPAQINRALLDSFYKLFDEISLEISQMIQRINHALALAWNTNREDLIELLSFQKECWEKYQKLVIGKKRKEEMPSSGLYARLESKLSSIFWNPNGISDVGKLDEEDPISEALIKFSIWYLKDYWELGLLSHIKDPKDLDLDPATTSDSKRADYRASLQEMAIHRLKEKGLYKVGDLKKHEIYSKEMLKNFLEI